jgi:broad specificity polyphosphatase/5'/3'-nucleotidase SurE
MFSYSPQVADRSGEIMAAGQMQAAQTNAQMMSDLGQNIGGALQSIGGTIGGAMQSNAQADSAFDAIAAIGQMYPGMKKISTALEGMDPRTRRLASMSILDNLGAISQLGIAGTREQMMPVMQAQKVTDQREIMYEREQLARERQAMSTPPAPAAVTVPPAMRRFGP